MCPWQHKSKRDKKPLATRTVHNVFYTVMVLLDAAVERRRLQRHQFQPPFKKCDKNPEKSWCRR